MVSFVAGGWPGLVFHSLLYDCDEWNHIYVGEGALVTLCENDVVGPSFVAVVVDPLICVTDCITHVSIGLMNNNLKKVSESNVHD